MRQQRVGYPRPDDHPQGADRRGERTFRNRQTTADAGQARDPQGKRQSHSENQEAGPIGNPQPDNCAENAPQRRFLASPFLIGVNG